MEAIEEIRRAEETAERTQKEAVLEAERIVKNAKRESEKIVGEAKRKGQEYIESRLVEAQKRIEELKKINEINISTELKKIEKKTDAVKGDALSKILEILSA